MAMALIGVGLILIDFVSLFLLVKPTSPDGGESANGTVILAWSGAISRDNLEKYVTPLLENLIWKQKLPGLEE